MSDLMQQYNSAPSAPRDSIVWWVQAVATLGALLNATGALIALINPALLVSPPAQISDAVHIYAGYMASRNLALALLLVALVAMRASRALGNLMALVGLIQLIDACIDCVEGRWPIVPGVLVFGVLFLICAARLAGYPFWKRAAWIS
jgi:hypothetical protein